MRDTSRAGDGHDGRDSAATTTVLPVRYSSEADIFSESVGDSAQQGVPSDVASTEPGRLGRLGRSSSERSWTAASALPSTRTRLWGGCQPTGLSS